MKADPIRLKIALFGIFGAGNLGNDCTLQALLHNIRRCVPNAKLTCVCSDPSETALRYKISTCSIREKPLPAIKNKMLRLLRRIALGIPMELYRWFTAIAALRSMDMLVMTGTGMLGDFGILPFDLHYDILRWSIVAKICRCKLLFLSVGVGPICDPLSRHLVKAALKLADYRSYRDGFSRKYLQRINFDTKDDTVCPDLAFSLPRALPRPNLPSEGGNTVIGVGLMAYYNKRGSPSIDETVYLDYLKKIARFVGWLRERNYKVRLIIGDFKYDQQVRKDLRLLLGEGDYENGTIIDEPASSADEVLTQLATTDFVVASRFHNVLLALALGKPVVALSYHEKVESLMTMAGLQAFCQDIERIDVDKLIDQFTSLVENAENLKPQIARRTQDYRKALDQQYDRVFVIV